MTLLNKLNQEQKEAVQHEDKPLLIVAGAGTGKTTVLINRLLYLITEKKVDPDNILLVTFTEKASQELIERADKALPYGYVNLWIHTFHGLCDHILREHGLDIGLNSDFQIINQTEQWILIKQNLDKFDLDYYSPLGNPDKFIIELIKHFSRLKDENISSSQYLDYALEFEQDKDTMLSAADKKHLNIDRINELANAFHVYNQLLLDNKLVDFGDLIVYTLKLFNQRPDILKLYQNKFKHVMVDEFQDTNWSQYELLKLLALPDNNLVATGDDDQSVFKFRGASLSNIMQFKDDYPDAKEVVLIKNYRSNQIILDHAYEFIKKNNPNRLETKLKIDKKIISQIEQPGEIKYLSMPSLLDETQTVAEMIKKLHNPGHTDWADMAVLVRANSTADRFTEELARQNIPNQFVSLRGLYYKPIILDIIAYLKLLDNYNEPVSLLRVLNFESFKINHLDIIAINKFARKKLWSLYEALQNISVITEASGALENVNKLLQSVHKHTQLSKQSRISKVFVQIVHDIFLPYLDHDKNMQEFDFLNQFYKKILRFEQANPVLLFDFLQLINLEMESGDTGSLKLNFEDADTVKVMTVHSAKGLEFKHVFLCDLVDKKFPTISRSDKIPLPDSLVKEFVPEGDIHLEEERRLFYVAMTRAKQGLYITGARDYGGVVEKKPSKFIAETGLEVQVIEADKSSELKRDLSNLDQEKTEVQISYELPVKFSFSQIESFNSCPWAYKHIYLLKIPMEPKPNTVFGRVIHNVLRDFFQPLLKMPEQADLFGSKKEINKELFSWEKILEIYINHWDDYGYENKKQAEEFKQKGKLMLKNFQQNLIDKFPNTVYLEKDFSFKIKDYIIKGAIDRVDQLGDGSVEIIDYKTGSPKTKIYFDDKKQLLLYQLALEQALNLKVSKLSYYYLDNNSLISFSALENDLEKLKMHILDIIDSIRQFDFTPTPGFVCKYCDFRNMCEFRKP
ncbi:MAG: UvrD-helicase domain-containing protein [bacterium]